MSCQYYFTYGHSAHYPYQDGWTTILAANVGQAIAIFRAVHPDITPGIVNCADIYTEEEFKKFFDDDNLGGGEHERYWIDGYSSLPF